MFYLSLADTVFGTVLSEALLQRLKSSNYVLNHALDRLVLDDPTSPLSVTFVHELGGEIPLLGPWLLNRGPYSWGGGPATVGRARYRYHRPFTVRSAATVRVIAELGQTITVQAIIPGGQAGHPLSAHYADQLAPWLAGRLDRIPARPSDVGGPVERLLP